MQKNVHKSGHERQDLYKQRMRFYNSNSNKLRRNKKKTPDMQNRKKGKLASRNDKAVRKMFQISCSSLLRHLPSIVSICV
jgi:hypothetical protein